MHLVGFIIRRNFNLPLLWMIQNATLFTLLILHIVAVQLQVRRIV